MGKRKDSSFEGDSSLESPLKRHKKHKKHKRKRPEAEADIEGEEQLPQEEDVEVDVLMSSPPTPPKPTIKLKLKIGSETVTKDVDGDGSEVESGMVKVERDDGIVWQDVKSDVFKTKKAGDDTSDEEQQWLDALEKGELDESGGVKRCRDPQLMTSRQRALLHGKPEEDLLQLPSGYRQSEDSKLSDEQIHKRQLKAKKRKEQAHQRAEKDKKQTLDRLLKKQQSKRCGPGGKGKGHGSQTPGLRYLSCASGISISVPGGVPFPCATQIAPTPPVPKMCEGPGCSNPRKYTCSKTGKSLCSLVCYKQNFEMRQV
ncbi:hypothetical protein CAPTEDRAFT_226354 [Capitella teleta]|uniref:INO80 complex subunit B-like conserved region domain-containing protein n=1 Tax=Capitella teleta TaxID=283909 RepID=R7UZH3_CAPTE|nr:hypothetical protein CAPTEDRAFT_226354 [Capitella teleta]|eukprot:ELU11674.1 hypothetical protein CAPTEDRAFT_226354 [Capitella teleta]